SHTLSITNIVERVGANHDHIRSFAWLDGPEFPTLSEEFGIVASCDCNRLHRRESCVNQKHHLSLQAQSRNGQEGVRARHYFSAGLVERLQKILYFLVAHAHLSQVVCALEFVND